MSDFRIGTRGSPLALAQSSWVKGEIERCLGVRAELIVIRTAGDRIIDRPLYEVGGKGLFVKEIEDALLRGEIDCAVHSLKDMPADLPYGLVLAAIPEREDPRDVLISHGGGDFASLPKGARLGTSSLRRASLARALRPDLDVLPLRGNVQTRLQKVMDGEFAATLLALAGLRRLGIDVPQARPLDPSTFVPAIGQAALAIETRESDASRLHAIDHAPSRVCITAERAFLQRVSGSCVTPLAAHAQFDGVNLSISAFIARPNGSLILRGEKSGAADAAATLGADLAGELLARGGAEILRDLARNS